MNNLALFQRFASPRTRAAAAFSLLLVAVNVWAAPVCVDPERGIGGTGGAARSGAIGGTGAAQGAIGGTGAVAGAIGGTGAPQGAIGGTGAVAGAIGGTGAPQGAIGGTGAVAAGAIGGTGAPQGAIGGTGAVAGAIGGTGAPQGAIGGTGAVAAGAVGGTGAKTNGGIGGTGTQMVQGVGGTGIVGTITGFASVCVNGLEVQYDDNTPVTANGAASSAKQLAVGQVVAIEAQASPRGLAAREIAVLHAVAGPITEVQPGMIRVMGQAVRLNGATRVAAGGAVSDAERLRPGTVVQVSGYRDAAGNVVASRVQEARDLAEHSAVGPVARLSERGFEVNGTRVEGRPEASLHDGAEALVRGHWQDGRLTAREVRAEPTAAAIGRAERVVVEGLVSRRDRGELSVGALNVRLSEATKIEGGGRELANDQLVRVTGRIDREHRVSAERIEIERGPGTGAARRGSEGDGKGGDAKAGGDSRGGDDDSGRSGSDDSGRSGSDDSGRSGSGRDASGRPDSGDRVERVERAERPEKAERIERPEKVERPEVGGGGGGGGSGRH